MIWLLFLIHSWVRTRILRLPIFLFFQRLLCCWVCPQVVAKRALRFHVPGSSASIFLKKSTLHMLFFLSLYSSALLLTRLLRCSRWAIEWPSTLVLSPEQVPRWLHGRRLPHIAIVVLLDLVLLPGVCLPCKSWAVGRPSTILAPIQLCLSLLEP